MRASSSSSVMSLIIVHFTLQRTCDNYNDNDADNDNIHYDEDDVNEDYEDLVLITMLWVLTTMSMMKSIVKMLMMMRMMVALRECPDYRITLDSSSSGCSGRETYVSLLLALCLAPAAMRTILREAFNHCPGGFFGVAELSTNSLGDVLVFGNSDFHIVFNTAELSTNSLRVFGRVWEF